MASSILGTSAVTDVTRRCGRFHTAEEIGATIVNKVLADLRNNTIYPEHLHVALALDGERAPGLAVA